MGSYLYLFIPNERKNDQRIINEYYDFLANKLEKMGKKDHTIVDYLNSERKYRLDFFYKNGYVSIYSQIISTFGKVSDDWRKAETEVFKIFQRDTYVIFGDEIKELIKILRNIKKKLVQKMQLKEPGFEDIEYEIDWEFSMESQQIALCEFALENGFGIEYP